MAKNIDQKALTNKIDDADFSDFGADKKEETKKKYPRTSISTSEKEKEMIDEIIGITYFKERKIINVSEIYRRALEHYYLYLKNNSELKL